jgi:hypothetical protein
MLERGETKVFVALLAFAQMLCAICAFSVSLDQLFLQKDRLYGISM